MLDYITFYLVFIACVYFYQPKILDPEYRVEDTAVDYVDEEYDFIVVGGGTAGCVVAARLSEIQKWKVLLLEAGGEETLAAETPLLAYTLARTEMDWNYTTTPQKHACLAYGGRCGMINGRVLGGSLAMNGMGYFRGVPKDFEEWEALGNEGWGWEDVLKYFVLSENNTNPERINDKRNHGTEGPLTISINEYRTELADAFLKAGNWLGYPEADLNGDSRIGFMHMESNKRDGKRCTTNKAFLQPARHRKNLHVAKNAHVKKINFQGNRVVGVTFIKDDIERSARAKKEVILCAGAVGSPRLLLLSGVGPKSHLDTIGIQNVADLPVGENLQDHLAVFSNYYVDSGAITKDEYMSLNSIMNFSMNSGGPLTSPYGHEIVAFMNSSRYQMDNPGVPAIEIVLSSFMPPGDESAFRSGGFPLRPKSRGCIKLNSPDPFDYPLIDPNFLADPEDFEIAIEVFELALKINEAPTMAKFNPRLIRDRCPQDYGTREFKECMVTKYASSGLHTVSTCMMSPDGVVDNKLKVRGIKGLRVADASVIPYVPRSNIFAIVIMIGEKVSDFIKENYGRTKLIE